MTFRTILKKIFPFFIVMSLFFACKDLFYGTKIYFILPQMIRKRKIIDKKKKKLDPAL
jgi:hypothetical protein